MNPSGVLDVIAELRAKPLLDPVKNAGVALPLMLATPIYVTADCLDLVEQARHGMEGETITLQDWIAPGGLTAAMPIAGPGAGVGDWTVMNTDDEYEPGTELPFLGGLFVLERPISIQHAVLPEWTANIDVIAWRAMRVLNLPRYGADGPVNMDFAAIDCYGRWNDHPERMHLVSMPIPENVVLRPVDRPEWWELDADYDERLVNKQTGMIHQNESDNMMRWLTENPDLPVFRQDMTLASTIATLYAFAQAEVIESRAGEFDRAQRRRAERAGVVPQSFTFDLPHRVRTGGAGETDGVDIDWSHRWWVRPHNRVLHRGTPMERTVRVRGYVKGPDGKPFVAKTPVAVLR